MAELKSDDYNAEDGAVDGAQEEVREGTVHKDWHGDRLDRVVTHLAPEFSRSFLQQLLRDGLILLDGKAIQKPSHKVTAGQALHITLRASLQSQAFVPQEMPLDIVYEDDSLLVLNKPAGLVVHPAAGNWQGTLLNGLLAYSPVFSTVPRAGIVHRLDKDTSGLMVVAKSIPMMLALVEMIAARDVSRQYWAIGHRVRGSAWPWKAVADIRHVNEAIGRDPHNRLRMSVVNLMEQAGKTAQTDIQLLSQVDDFAWMLCRLHTGRTHQIRVHAKHLGVPLVGDAVYGGAPHALMPRQALHAWRLAFAHPKTGDEMVFHAAVPDDMAALAVELGLGIPQSDGDGMSGASS